MRAVVKVLPTEGHHTNLSNEPNFYVEVEVGCQKCSQVFRNFFDSLLDFPPDFPLPDFLPTFPATFFPGLLQTNPEHFVLVINPSEPSQSAPILGDIASTISRKVLLQSKYPAAASSVLSRACFVLPYISNEFCAGHQYLTASSVST